MDDKYKYHVFNNFNESLSNIILSLERMNCCDNSSYIFNRFQNIYAYLYNSRFDFTPQDSVIKLHPILKDLYYYFDITKINVHERNRTFFDDHEYKPWNHKLPPKMQKFIKQLEIFNTSLFNITALNEQHHLYLYPLKHIISRNQFKITDRRLKEGVGFSFNRYPSDYMLQNEITKAEYNKSIIETKALALTKTTSARVKNNCVFLHVFCTYELGIHFYKQTHATVVLKQFDCILNKFCKQYDLSYIRCLRLTGISVMFLHKYLQDKNMQLISQKFQERLFKAGLIQIIKLFFLTDCINKWYPSTVAIDADFKAYQIKLPGIQRLKMSYGDFFRFWSVNYDD